MVREHRLVAAAFGLGPGAARREVRRAPRIGVLVRAGAQRRRRRRQGGGGKEEREGMGKEARSREDGREGERGRGRRTARRATVAGGRKSALEDKGGVAHLRTMGSKKKRASGSAPRTAPCSESYLKEEAASGDAAAASETGTGGAPGRFFFFHGRSGPRLAFVYVTRPRETGQGWPTASAFFSLPADAQGAEGCLVRQKVPVVVVVVVVAPARLLRRPRLVDHLMAQKARGFRQRPRHRGPVAAKRTTFMPSPRRISIP